MITVRDRATCGRPARMPRARQRREHGNAHQRCGACHSRLFRSPSCNGGAEGECGWCKDHFGLSWQITPRALMDAFTDPDRAAAKRAFDAMMTMQKIDIAAIEAARRG